MTRPIGPDGLPPKASPHALHLATDGADGPRRTVSILRDLSPGQVRLDPAPAARTGSPPALPRPSPARSVAPSPAKPSGEPPARHSAHQAPDRPAAPPPGQAAPGRAAERDVDIITAIVK